MTAGSARHGAWIRDFQKVDEYVTPGGEDFSGWAWEFLRRNPDYQEAVDRLRVDVDDENIDPVRDSDRFRASARFGVHDLFDYRLCPRDLPPDLFIERGGLPNDAHGPWLLAYGRPVEEERRRVVETLAEQGRLIVYGFDLGADIGPQVVELQKSLNEHRRTITRSAPRLPDALEPERDLRLLVVLDGLAKGARPAAIKKALGWQTGSNDGDYRRAVERALRYRDEDYRRLTFKSPGAHMKKGKPPRANAAPALPLALERLARLEAIARRRRAGDIREGGDVPLTPESVDSHTPDQNDTSES